MYREFIESCRLDGFQPKSQKNHGGLSEVALGKALRRYPRDSFYFSTKMPVKFMNKAEDMERIFQEIDFVVEQLNYLDWNSSILGIPLVRKSAAGARRIVRHA